MFPILSKWSFKPVLLSEDGEWALEATVSNVSTETLSGIITVKEPIGGWSGPIAPAAFPGIAPGQSITVVIPAGQPGAELYSVSLQAELSGGTTVTVSRPTSFLAAVNDGAAIAVDGILSAMEWEDGMPFALQSASQVRGVDATRPWQGTGDLSGMGYLKWDADNLYLAVSVTDDSHYQSETGSGIWRGDSIQFAIDPFREQGPGSAGNHEIGIALSASGVQKWRWTAAAGKTAGSIPGMSAAVVRDESAKTTTYEASIPWTELLPEGEVPQAGNIIGFSLLINDNDDGARKNWIQYMGGIGDSKSPLLCGDLALWQTAESP